MIHYANSTEPAFDSVLCHEFDDNLNAEESMDISREVNEVLSQIYNEFFNDFSSRKEKRLKGDSLSEVQQYNLIVKKSYLHDYQYKVEQIVYNSHYDSIYSFLKTNARQFATKLKNSLYSVKNTNTRLMLLHDAYHVTINVSDEVGKITSSLFRHERKLNCERLNLAYFYEIVCEGLDGTLQWARSQKDLPRQVIYVLELVDELNRRRAELIRYTGPDYDLTKNLEIETQSISTEADYIDDSPMWAMTIDEIVEFIEPSKPKRKRRKRKNLASARTASNSNSPQKESEEDLEIEKFKQRLAEIRPAEKKLKPNLRADWLQALRSKLS